jgi:hypothetical protein
MAKFCFYHGEDNGIVNRLRQEAIFCWGDIAEETFGSFSLFIAADDYKSAFGSTEYLIGAISGYARCAGEQKDEPKRRLLTEISEKKLPLGDDWTGSFAAVAYSKATDEITLCNDILGQYPMYYARFGREFIGGTSLIVLSRALDSEIDAVGVLQRITVPFCNYGRRTLLKNVHRLLPGERLKWSKDKTDVSRDYDNSLCGEVIDTNVETAARMVWDCLSEEVSTAIGGHEKISVAMSGGWDSRLLLGGMKERGLSVSCLTYGDENHYETKIARRCAVAVGASHESFSIENKYFPARRQIESLIKETESGNYFEWFGIIEKARSNGAKMPLLLGDLCESIDGRYITEFSTRKARVNSFLRELKGEKETFTLADDANFERWRDEKRAEITASLLKNLAHLSDDLADSMTKEQFVEEIKADLELSFVRVCDHAPPFAALYDELFIWFHRIRFLLGNQITWLGAAFRPVSPGLSMRFLRLMTTIHPRLRIRKRLMNAIIRLPEFDSLARIPSAQIPFIGSRAPAVVRDVLWGTRSVLDKLLIKRTMKTKNAEGRQRVLPSLNYMKEYRRENTAANVENWFSGRYIKSENYRRVLRERAALNAWTLINVDIAAPANVSIILDLCSAESEIEEVEHHVLEAAEMVF